MKNKIDILFRKIYVKKIVFILFILSVDIFVSFKMYEFPFSLNRNIVLETDGIFTQVQIQSITQGAIFQRTSHLSYPFGYSQWVVPQFSIIESLLIWLAGQIDYFTNFGLLILDGFFIIVLNTLSFYLLAHYFNLGRLTKILFPFLGATLPFVLNSITHPHVMKIFTISIYLILLKILIEKRLLTLFEKFFLIFYLLASSLYWINVFFAIFSCLLIIYGINLLVQKIDDIKNFIIVLKLFLINFSLLLIYVFFFLSNRDISGENGRGKWHSDIFSGKFTDLLLSSPFFNNYINRIQNLYDGASTEIKANMVGAPLAICFFYLLYIILNFRVNPKSETRYILQISIISLLFFVIGGLSNLQSAVFVLINTASPMRTWSRLSILLAIIGLLLFFILLQNYRKTKILISLFFIFLASLDVIFLPKYLQTEENWRSNDYYSAINFIEKNIQPCPILQLPIDSYLVPQSALDGEFKYYWTDQIPYLFLPSHSWTSATYGNTNGWRNLIKIPTTLVKEDLENLRQNYCAIIFDKDFSNWQIARNAGINLENGGLTNSGNWPGKEILITQPNFEDSRFRVYILNESKKY